MSKLDISTSRTMLNTVHTKLRQRFPNLNVKTSAWTHFNGVWEFHGPEKFVWKGEAANAYDARCKGWLAWLDYKGKQR